MLFPHPLLYLLTYVKLSRRSTSTVFKGGKREGWGRDGINVWRKGSELQTNFRPSGLQLNSGPPKVVLTQVNLVTLDINIRLTWGDFTWLNKQRTKFRLTSGFDLGRCQQNSDVSLKKNLHTNQRESILYLKRSKDINGHEKEFGPK